MCAAFLGGLHALLPDAQDAGCKEKLLQFIGYIQEHVERPEDKRKMKRLTLLPDDMWSHLSKAQYLLHHLELLKKALSENDMETAKLIASRLTVDPVARMLMSQDDLAKLNTIEGLN